MHNLDYWCEVIAKFASTPAGQRVLAIRFLRQRQLENFYPEYPFEQWIQILEHDTRALLDITEINGCVNRACSCAQ